jgi:uncharacterized protein
MDADHKDAEVTNNTSTSRFELDLGEDTGFLTYTMQPGNVYVLTHTEVPPQYQGQGIGDRLARGALDQIREAGGRVVPVCGFVKAFIQREPEYSDLVAPGGE